MLVKVRGKFRTLLKKAQILRSKELLLKKDHFNKWLGKCVEISSHLFKDCDLFILKERYYSKYDCFYYGLWIIIIRIHIQCCALLLIKAFVLELLEKDIVEVLICFHMYAPLVSYQYFKF